MFLGSNCFPDYDEQKRVCSVVIRMRLNNTMGEDGNVQEGIWRSSWTKVSGICGGNDTSTSQGLKQKMCLLPN